MTTLEEKVNAIITDEEFNNLPFEERKRIGKFISQMQILTIWQMIHKDESLTTEAWRNKQRRWLRNCVDSFQTEYDE